METAYQTCGLASVTGLRLSLPGAVIAPRACIGKNLFAIEGQFRTRESGGAAFGLSLAWLALESR